MLHYISRGIFRIILNLFFRMKVSGLENVPKSGGFIVAGNHVSFMDPPVVGSACSRKLNYMARHDLFFNPILAFWLNRVGAFPVERGKADISALKEAISRVRRQEGLLLFPEGRRLESGEEGVKAEAGIGFLVEKLEGVPVIPVHVDGTQRALPKGAKFFSPARISVKFGRQIQIDRGKSYQEIAQLIMDNVRRIS